MNDEGVPKEKKEKKKEKKSSHDKRDKRARSEGGGDAAAVLGEEVSGKALTVKERRKIFNKTRRCVR